MSSLLRRVVRSRHLISPRKYCTAAAAVARRELAAPSSPWLMLPPSFVGERGDMVYNFYSPVKDRVISFNNRGGNHEADLMRSHSTAAVVGSSHGWLALYDSRNHSLCLSNPLSGRRIGLPPLVGRPFRDEEKSRCPFKVILSGSPHEEDCRALMILSSCDRVAFCRPGRSNKWSPLGRWYDDPVSVTTYNDLRLYFDFVYSAADKNFFGFLLSGRRGVQELEGWDVADPVRPRTVRLDRFGLFKLPLEPSFPSGMSLVCGEQPGELFLVTRNFLFSHKSSWAKFFINEEKFDVNVYRIKDGELELCSSLGDLVLFVGLNHSVAVKASRFPQLKPNSIYFSEGTNLLAQFIGVLDYQNKACSPLYHPSLLQPKRPAQTWFTPTLD